MVIFVTIRIQNDMFGSTVTSMARDTKCPYMSGRRYNSIYKMI